MEEGMKRGVFSILAILAVFAMVTLGCPEPPPAVIIDKNIEFAGLGQDGSATSSTTELWLDFDKTIEGLSANDIKLTGIGSFSGFTKGALSNSGARYTLKITTTGSGKLKVEVEKEGFTITGSPKEVDVYFYSPPGATQAELTGVTANGSATETTTQLTLVFDKAITGLKAEHITLTHDDGVTIVTKGDLSSGGTGTYTLPIGVTKSGKLKVAVANPPNFAIKGSTKDNVSVYYVKTVAFTSLAATGSLTETTTQLTLVFESVIPGLNKFDFEFSGVSNIIPGELTNPAGASAYLLPISGFEEGGELTVTVTKDGFKINPPSRSVTIFFKVEEVEFVSVEADGELGTSTTTELTLTFDKPIAGLSASNITLSDPNAIMGLLETGTVDGDGNTTYTLPISGFTVDGDGKATLTVTVAKPPSYIITSSPQSVEVYLVNKPVTLNSVVADGSASETTTALTLTFSEAIPGLSADNITLTPDVEKGTLTSAGSVYTLPISGFTAGGTLTVEVSIFGYAIKDSGGDPFVSEDVTIYYSDIPITLSNVTADGDTNTTTTELTLTFNDLIDDLSEDDITLTGVAGVVKGTLTDGTGFTYILPISGFTVGGNLIVEVAKEGYIITGSPKTVEIYVAAGSGGGEDGLKIKVGAADKVVEVIGVGGTVDYNVDKTGYTFTREVAWEASYAYFAVNFGTDKFNDYEKIKFVYQGVSGDIGYKDIYLLAKDTAFAGDLGGAGVTAATISDNQQMNGTDAKDVTLNITRTTATGFTNPTVYLSLYFNADKNKDGASTAFTISNIELVKAAAPFVPVKVDILTIPAVRAPVDGQTPVVTLSNVQYEGTVTWSPTVTGSFAQGTAYTATIALTAKTGYTFNGVDANAFTVSGATTATSPAGTADSLTVTAVFPATASSVMDKTITFTAGSVIAGNTNAEVKETNASDFTFEMKAGYGPFVYFKVTFDTGVKLSDYSKFDITFEGLAGDSGWKRALVLVSENVPTSVAENGYIFRSDQNDNKDGDGHAAAKSSTITDFSKVTSEMGALNEVYIAVYFWSGAATWKISGIKFSN